MGLRIKNNSANRTAISLEKRGVESTRQLRKVHRDAAFEIAEIGAEMAPYKTGELEMSVHVEEDRGGVGGRKVFTIAADAAHAGYMHEGVYNLGPGSQAKDAASQFPVGRKFLSRAVSYVLIERGFYKRAIAAVQASWRKRG